MEALEQVHSRHLDRKNMTIKHLEHDLDESEEQYCTAIQAHLISIDTLVNLHHQRLENLRNQFETDVTMLDTEFNSERYSDVTQESDFRHSTPKKRLTY